MSCPSSGTTPPTGYLPNLIPSAAAFRRRGVRLLSVAVVVAFLAVVPAQRGSAASPPVVIGAVGDVSGLSGSIGAPLAVNAYGRLDGNVPTGKMVNMKSTVTWRSLANASAGSAIYNNVVRWAKALKARAGTTYFAFHHEPEAKTNTSMGTATDYIAAYRHVVDIFRAQGAGNVEYVWQMTYWAFATSSSDRRYADKWYPGASYVTHVGADPYNFYNCGPGNGKWVELKEVTDPALAWSRAHGKTLVLAEFGSQSDARRAQWLRNAQAYLAANKNTIRAVFYFQATAQADCHFLLQNTADIAAFRSMANDANFTS